MRKTALLVIGIATIATTTLFGCAKKEEVELQSIETEAEEELSEIDLNDLAEEVSEEIESSEEEQTFATLEDYYAQPEIKELLDAQLATQLESAAISNYYSNITVEFVGNECIYSYYFKDEVAGFDAEATKSSIKSITTPLFSSMRSEAGIAAEDVLTITYKYFDKDGNELGSVSFTDPEEATEEVAADAEVEAEADADVVEEFVEEE